MPRTTGPLMADWDAKEKAKTARKEEQARKREETERAHQARADWEAAERAAGLKLELVEVAHEDQEWLQEAAAAKKAKQAEEEAAAKRAEEEAAAKRAAEEEGEVPTVPDLARRLFMALDVDKDRKVDYDEMMRIYDETGRWRWAELKQLFGDLDFDNNRQVSVTEWCTYFDSIEAVRGYRATAAFLNRMLIKEAEVARAEAETKAAAEVAARQAAEDGAAREQKARGAAERRAAEEEEARMEAEIKAAEQEAARLHAEEEAREAEAARAAAEAARVAAEQAHALTLMRWAYRRSASFDSSAGRALAAWKQQSSACTIGRQTTMFSNTEWHTNTKEHERMGRQTTEFSNPEWNQSAEAVQSSRPAAEKAEEEQAAHAPAVSDPEPRPGEQADAKGTEDEQAAAARAAQDLREKNEQAASKRLNAVAAKEPKEKDKKVSCC